MDQIRTVNQILDLKSLLLETVEVDQETGDIVEVLSEKPVVLEDKHYYVMGRSAGIVFNILGADNYDQ